MIVRDELPRKDSKSLTQTGYIGKSEPRANAKRLLQGRGSFIDDLRFPRLAQVVFLRSPHAHAKIKSLDFSRARAAPGVIGVFDGYAVVFTFRNPCLRPASSTIWRIPSASDISCIDCLHPGAGKPSAGTSRCHDTPFGGGIASPRGGHDSPLPRTKCTSRHNSGTGHPFVMGKCHTANMLRHAIGPWLARGS